MKPVVLSLGAFPQATMTALAERFELHHFIVYPLPDGTPHPLRRDGLHFFQPFLQPFLIPKRFQQRLVLGRRRLPLLQDTVLLLAQDGAAGVLQDQLHDKVISHSRKGCPLL